jgi:hypothetical protein
MIVVSVYPFLKANFTPGQATKSQTGPRTRRPVSETDALVRAEVANFVVRSVSAFQGFDNFTSHNSLVYVLT